MPQPGWAVGGLGPDGPDVGAQPRAPPWSAAPARRPEEHRHLAWQQCLLAAPLAFVRTESVTCPLGHPGCPLSSVEEGAWTLTGVVVCPGAWLAGTHVGSSPEMFDFKAWTAASVLPVSRNVPPGDTMAVVTLGSAVVSMNTAWRTGPHPQSPPNLPAAGPGPGDCGQGQAVGPCKVAMGHGRHVLQTRARRWQQPRASHSAAQQD